MTVPLSNYPRFGSPTGRFTIETKPDVFTEVLAQYVRIIDGGAMFTGDLGRCVIFYAAGTYITLFPSED